MPNVGPLELVIVLIVALVVLGPKRLPEVGRSLGNGIREFKDSISNEGHHEDHVDIEEAPEPVATAAAAAVAPPAADAADDKPAS
jgi:sec-independent protein translocase protein TatA